jgi:cytochrome b6-f complex iron-sulfur subunit
MAAMTSTLGQAKLGCSTGALRARQPAAARAAPVQTRAAAGGTALNEMVPDRSKRTTMNWLLVGGLGLPGTAMLGPFAYFFKPNIPGAGTGGTVAKDALGNDVKATEWLASHKKGDRSLTQGLKSDATYLIVTDNGEIETFGLNAVCTHLGCVVPWNSNLNRFACPCHGSQYNAQGKVVRGPAPLSLALAHTDITDDIVSFKTWTETDFRTGEKPWWS